MFVIETEEMEDCGVKVVDVDLVLDSLESKLVSGSDRDAGFDPAACQEHAKAVRVMVAGRSCLHSWEFGRIRHPRGPAYRPASLDVSDP